MENKSKKIVIGGGAFSHLLPIFSKFFGKKKKKADNNTVLNSQRELFWGGQG